MHQWNQQFMAHFRFYIVNFNTTYVDRGGAPANPAT